MIYFYCTLYNLFIDIWELQKFKYDWPSESEKEAGLFRNFTIEDNNRERCETPVKHAVFIQVLNHSPEEAGFYVSFCIIVIAR